MTESVSESRPAAPSENDFSEGAGLRPALDDARPARGLAGKLTWAGAAYAAVLALSSICFLWARKQHELSYPVPWPDEGSFLWPALAFRDHFTLYAPELFPDREVFWMPPGFMVLEGLIFKLWTFSLGRARLLSALYLLAALGGVASLLKGSRVRIGHAVVIVLFLFSPTFELAGNTARMETLVLLVASIGCLLLDRKRWAGLGVLALGPLVHPIGCVFLLVGAAYWFGCVRTGKVFERADRIVLATVGVFWILYAAHVVPHFRWFYRDMASQMKFKSYVSAAGGGPLSRLHEPLMLAAFAGFAAAVAAALRLGAKVGALGVLCLSSLVAATFTQGWLYDVYPAFAVLLGSILWLEAGAAFVTRDPLTSAATLTFLKLAALAGLVAFVDANWAVNHPFLTRSVRSSTRASVLDAPYAGAEEQRQVSEFLRAITPAKRTVSVQFLPDADGLLFEAVRTPTMKFVQQTFYVTSPDVFIVHRSPWFPPMIFEVELMSFVLRSGVTVSLDQWQRIAQGDGGSEWLVLRKLPGKIDWR